MAAFPDFDHSLFVEGTAGSGKTSACVQYITTLITDGGVLPENILVLVPHPTLGLPYSRVATSTAVLPEVTTISGLARMVIPAFWSVIAPEINLNPEVTEPAFLSADLAQYYLSRFVQPYWELGIFDSIRLPKYRVVSQILDIINNSVLAGFSLEEAQARLIAAWGERHSSRARVYETAVEIAQQYKEFCRKNALLDYSLQLHLLVDVLLDNPHFQGRFRQEFRYFVAENVEEMGALVHDFVFWATETVDKTIIIYDQNAGYRTFLGADPTNAYLLRDVCHQHFVMDSTVAVSRPIQVLIEAAQNFFHPPTPSGAAVPIDAFKAAQITSSTFYPQMIDHCVQQVQSLVAEQQVSPSQIAIIAPYLHDSLLFSLQSRLQTLGIPSVYYRPSRPFKSEPSVQALLTLLRLACRNLNAAPTNSEVSQAFGVVIADLDPIRGGLLSQAAYRQKTLAKKETIAPAMIDRIGTTVLERYDRLQQWLSEHAPAAEFAPDHFLSQMMEDVLSQPGFYFNQKPEAGHIVAEFISVAQRFCNSTNQEDDKPIIHEFFQFTQNGFISSDWETERSHAVFISPAHTYLTRNMVVDYQFWLDAGDSGWYERLEQPLTHPYILRRNFPADGVWTDELEQEAQSLNLQNLILGLLRRCRKSVFVELCDISASGYEQRGQLLLLLQHIFNQIPVHST